MGWVKDKPGSLGCGLARWAWPGSLCGLPRAVRWQSACPPLASRACQAAGSCVPCSATVAFETEKQGLSVLCSAVTEVSRPQGRSVWGLSSRAPGLAQAVARWSQHGVGAPVLLSKARPPKYCKVSGRGGLRCGMFACADSWLGVSLGPWSRLRDSSLEIPLAPQGYSLQRPAPRRQATCRLPRDMGLSTEKCVCCRV